MKVRKQIYKFYIPHTEQLDALCRTSNDLYNQALYIFRQRLYLDGIWTWYGEMDKIMKNTLNLEGECNYKKLKAQCSQQILRLLENNIKNYCRSIKGFVQQKQNNKRKPNLPNYRRRGDLFCLFYTNQSSTIKDGRIRLRKDLYIDIPQWDKYKDNIISFSQIRIIPNKINIKVEIVYDKKIIQSDVDKGKCASIDLGVDNIVALAINEGCILFNGRYLKSYNKYFNKKLSILQSIKDMQKIKHSTKKIHRLYYKRDRFFEDVFHKISSQIVDILIEKKIGTLAVGYNVGWKNKLNMGKSNNQTFVQIPFARLINYFEYKCAMVGINFIKHEESYTSKCDALAFEKIGRHEEYLGKRIKRGLFRSSVGKLINADHNGALNIMRKVVGDSYVREIVDRGHSLRPVRYRHLFMADRRHKNIECLTI